MSYFSNNSKYKELIEKPFDIKPLLKDEMILISGDFYGIQKFIFDRLATKNASKVLRAKSAFIQMFTEYLAKYICNEFGVDESCILSKNAGKFEILIPKNDVSLDEIQKKVDNYFIDNFYGLSGVMLSFVNCTKEDFEDTKKYKALRKKIIDSVEDKKFQKFSLFKKDAFDVLSYDTNIDNKTLCPICNIRKIENKKEHCSICNSFRNLGKKLSYEHQEELISSEKIGIDFDNFITDIKLTKKIKSYVLFDKDNPADFNTLADSSCKDLETGIKALAILKADVDNMGKFLEKSDVTNSFENFDSFSKTMDNFFSIYIPQQLMKNKYKNTYTVFAGGDDLFLVGAWDEILNLAREIEKEFKEFVESDDLSISFGIAIAKPSTPISYLADYTEHLLEEAKDIDGEKEVEHPKDAISLFAETVKWKEYNEVNKKLEPFYNIEQELNSSTLYTLLEITNMAIRFKYRQNGFTLRDALWKSKIRYLFNRNIDAKYHNLIELLNDSLQNYPKATKMFLVEFIYKRRKE